MKSWRKGQELAVFIYKNFGTLKDFSFKDQICRAAVSVSDNQAEGFDRGSDKEFLRFLFITRGSNSEVKSMLFLEKNLEYINEHKFEEDISLSEKTGKLINGFISYLMKSIQNNNQKLTMD